MVYNDIVEGIAALRLPYLKTNLFQLHDELLRNKLFESQQYFKNHIISSLNDFHIP